MTRKRLARATLALVGTVSALGLVACSAEPKSNGAAATSASAPHTGPRSPSSICGGAEGIEPAGFLGVPVHRASFDRLLRAVKEIGEDKDVKGVFVRFGDASDRHRAGRGIGDLLAHVRETKPVYCQGNGFTNATIYAAARACSKIFRVACGGSGGDRDRGPGRLLPQAPHRGAARDGRLPAGREIQGGRRAVHPRRAERRSARVSRRGPRGHSILVASRCEEGADAGWRRRRGRGWAYSPSAAKARGLIDEIAYADETLEALKKATGAVREETLFGAGAAEKDDDLGDVIRMLAGSHGGTAPIALIRATGSIAMSGGNSLLGGASGITEKEMSRLLARCEKDDGIKAVVLRIDSPGGSALASDLIWHEMRKVHAKKPIVVSMGDLAASGGYYISSAANVIFAEPTSIVGSIGVVGARSRSATRSRRSGLFRDVPREGRAGRGVARGVRVRSHGLGRRDQGARARIDDRRIRTVPGARRRRARDDARQDRPLRRGAHLQRGAGQGSRAGRTSSAGCATPS